MDDNTTLLREHDEGLSLLRQSWLDAPVTDKPKWIRLINKALDERLLLMEVRDAKPSAS